MAVQLTQGTIEYLILSVTDQLGAINDLAGSNPLFSVYRVSDKAELMTDVPGSTHLMDVYCLVDTTTGSGLTTPTVPVNGWWGGGNEIYHLYCKFNIGAETPRLGPFAFTIDAS